MVRSGFLQRGVQRILQINDTPHSIGLGAAIGMFLAMTPTVGIQIILATIICTAIRANRIAAIALVFISNPLTMIPIYWLNYWIGARFTGDRMISRQDFEAIWQRITDAGIIGGIREAAIVLTGEIFVPMMLGGTLLGLLLALPLYPITIRSVRSHRVRRDQKHALDHLRSLRNDTKMDEAAETTQSPRTDSDVGESSVRDAEVRPPVVGERDEDVVDPPAPLRRDASSQREEFVP